MKSTYFQSFLAFSEITFINAGLFRITPVIELYGSRLFLYEYDEATGDKAYILKGLRYLEATIPLNTIPYDKEHNLVLANMLFEVRIALIETANQLQDITGIPSSRHFLTKIKPGSLINGVPASLINATDSPSFNL